MKNHRMLVFIVILLLVGFSLSLWPLLHPGFFASDDGEWMIIRLSAFYQSFRDGQFPVRFLGRLNQSYGYPVSNFLYPGFLYIGTALRGVGISFVHAIKLIFAFSVLGSSFFLYKLLREKFARLSASVGTFVFIVSPYLLYDMYTRGSVGEVLAFLPFFASLYAVEFSFIWLLPLSVAFLILSHNSLAILFFLVIAGYIIYKKKFYLLIHSLLGVGLASFFWMPAIFEKQFVQVDAIVVSDVYRYFIKPGETYLYGVGIVAWVVLLCRRLDHVSSDVKYFILIFFVGLVFSLQWSFWLWNVLGLGFLFQFPFRFLSLVVISSPFIVSQVIETSSRKKLVSLSFIALAVFCAISVLSGIRFVDRPMGYYTTNEATTTVKNEFMPRWATKSQDHRALKRIEIYEGKGVLDITYQSSQRIAAKIVAEEPLIVQVNSVYYPGWGASLNGQRAGIKTSSFGLMHILVPEGTHTLVVEFRETPFRFAADSISFLSLVVYGFIKKTSRKEV
ncbi:hypothetical protein HY947_02935 [Candidatus Gottesmanbacteria bacterium]|nr:hypothetical protein [Candidatus Gottesmanbacteria bacterium]